MLLRLLDNNTTDSITCTLIAGAGGNKYIKIIKHFSAVYLQGAIVMINYSSNQEIIDV